MSRPFHNLRNIVETTLSNSFDTVFSAKENRFDRQKKGEVIILRAGQENKSLAEGGFFMELNAQIKKYRGLLQTEYQKAGFGS